jgi:UDP-N-acetylglucosamine 1-carboxyvinyltransferase
MVEVLEHLGVGCAWKGDALILDTTEVRSVETPYELVSRMRASILVLGPLLARFGNAQGRDARRVATSGRRAIDLHIRGLEKMGAPILVRARVPVGETLRPPRRRVNLDFPSVGATENVPDGRRGGARGPRDRERALASRELVDLANFLSEDGRAGSRAWVRRRSRSQGVEGSRRSTTRDPGPGGSGDLRDRGLLDGGTAVLSGRRGRPHGLVLSKLADAGADVLATDGGVAISMGSRARCVDLVTLPYPGSRPISSRR